MARTQATLDALVARLQCNCGDMFDACRTVGVSMMFVRKWGQDDKDVAAQLTEAERVGAMALQSEAIRRAVQGDEKAVYFKGEVVGYEYPKSDGLLQSLLKGRIPEVFSKDSEGSGGIAIYGANAQINIMPRANNYEEWLRMKSSTLALRETDAAQAATDATALLSPPMIDITPSNAFEGIDL